jgi:hypothetical protein
MIGRRDAGGKILAMRSEEQKRFVRSNSHLGDRNVAPYLYKYVA